MHPPPSAAAPLEAATTQALPLPPATPGSVWRSIRARILGGLLIVLPILVTLWIVYWIYSTLEKRVIDPLAQVVLWKIRGANADVELPFWFETYAAPVIAILVTLLILYGLGFFAHSRVRQAVDWLLLRLPVVSLVYNGVLKVVQTLDRQGGQQRPQRVVLIPFPHPGMKVPAFVTSTCRDAVTQTVLLCVYVPTTPVPTSGYFLLVPESDVTELNWTPEQTLQAIISGGLATPPEVSFYRTPPAIPGDGQQGRPMIGTVAQQGE